VAQSHKVCSVAIALAVVALPAGAGASLERAAPRALLPDLVARAPWDVAVRRAGDEHRLVFASAAVNVGAGPLEVVGERPDTSVPTMQADQVARLGNGSTRRHEGVGALHYVVSDDHQHWHLLGFMRYELRRASGGGAVLRDRKTGFCLGDRFDTRRRLPGKPRKAVFRGQCGLRQTGSLRVREGISVGYGDDYRAELEGQYLDLTGVPAGRYRLVHTVDEDGLLRERTHANNVAWVLVRLSWRGGRPEIRLGARCGASRRCRI
jgi:hypothetical protein